MPAPDSDRIGTDEIDFDDLTARVAKMRRIIEEEQAKLDDAARTESYRIHNVTLGEAEALLRAAREAEQAAPLVSAALVFLEADEAYRQAGASLKAEDNQASGERFLDAMRAVDDAKAAMLDAAIKVREARSC